MTRTRPSVTILPRTKKEWGRYSGDLERPLIMIEANCPEGHVENVIVHETIHWVLHKRMGEWACSLFDRIMLEFWDGYGIERWLYRADIKKKVTFD